jgi:dephospho-CoA kinase
MMYRINNNLTVVEVEKLSENESCEKECSVVVIHCECEVQYMQLKNYYDLPVYERRAVIVSLMGSVFM